MEDGVDCVRGKEGGRRTDALWQGNMKSPHPISVCTQTFTPHSERVANGAHADKGGGYVGKRGGVGARTAEQRRRKGGARANTVWRRTPPSSGTRGMGSSPLCTSQTGGGNGRGRCISLNDYEFDPRGRLGVDRGY